MGEFLDDYTLCGGHPDEETEPPSCHKPGDVCEILAAIGYDGKVVVVEAPESFVYAMDYGRGSVCFEDGLRGPQDAGVYRFRVKFCFEPGQGEAGSRDPGGDDWWYEEIAWADQAGEWHNIPDLEPAK